MPISVKLSDELVNKARQYGEVYHRSTPKQIEYWARIGKLSEENPELSYSMIKDILLAKKDAENGQVSPYEFGS